MGKGRNLYFVASALVGTAVGTVAGLLLAPRAGADTRQNLRRMAGELGEQLPLRLSDLRTRGQDAWHRVPRLGAPRWQPPEDEET